MNFKGSVSSVSRRICGNLEKLFSEQERCPKAGDTRLDRQTHNAYHQDFAGSLLVGRGSPAPSKGELIEEAKMQALIDFSILQ